MLAATGGTIAKSKSGLFSIDIKMTIATPVFCIPVSIDMVYKRKMIHAFT